MSDKQNNTPNPDQTQTTDNGLNQSELDTLRAELRDNRDTMQAVAETLLSEVPDHLKALIPENIGPAHQIAWFKRAKETGVFDSKPTVPETDSGKPTVTPTDPDVNELPPIARMALGYGK